MADRPIGLAPAQAVGAPELAGLAESCRDALRSSREYGRWLTVYWAALPELCRWAAAEDQQLLGRLRRHRRTRNALTQFIADRWTRAGVEGGADERRSTLIAFAEAILCDDPPGADVRLTLLVKNAIQPKSRPVGLVAEEYRELVDTLRPAFVGAIEDVRRRPGWAFLLTDAASALVRAGDPAVALQLQHEAWDWIGHLSTGSVDTAKAIGHMASGYATALGHLPTAKADAPGWQRRFDMAIDQLSWARELLLRHIPDKEVAHGLIGVGIAESHLWFCLRRKFGLPWLETEARRLEVLLRAEQDLHRALGLAAQGIGSPRRATGVPEQLHSSVSRMLMDTASAAAVVGDHERVTVALHRAFAFCHAPHQRLQVLLHWYHVAPGREIREDVLGEALREVRRGVLDEVTGWQRANLISRLVHDANDFSKTLYSDRRQTTAWFWRKQAAAWQRLLDDPEPVPPGNPSNGNPADGPGIEELDLDSVPVDEPQEPAQVPPLAGSPELIRQLLTKLEQQNIPAMVLALRQIATDPPAPAPAPILALQAVDRWRPERRGSRPGRLAPADCRTGGDVARAALELADEFALGYTEYLRSGVLNDLASHPGLSPEQSWDAAQDSFQSAIRSSRWHNAIVARTRCLELARDAGDTGQVVASTSSIIEVIDRALAQAGGTADLIDLARRMTTVSLRIAAMLAGAGFAAPAFDVAQAASGLLSRSFVGNPQLVEELELAERRAGAESDPEAKARLFELISDRIAAPPADVRVPVRRPVSVMRDYGRSVATIQLFGSWAVGCTMTDGRAEYWVTEIPLSPESLTRLRKAVWDDLNPVRAGRAATALTNLHDRIVRPLLPHIAGAADLVVIPHGDFAGLPVHAARGDDSYLIERHRVSYLPYLVDPLPVSTVARSALVGGWDPEIGAPGETVELANQLRRLEFRVTRKNSAQHGRPHFLDPQSSWGLVHVAAHGDFYPWPISMTSRLRFSSKVTVSAGDWLREGCRTMFGFINACTVGRYAPHAGDLNGFPLALRVRGATATISALSLLPSAPARAFAVAFYTEWPNSDSLSAYQATCIESIRRSEPPCWWAPYLHTGLPVRLAGPSGVRPARSNSGQKKRARRGR